MGELFKNAKFGDKFRTRDGRCAIYCKCVRTPDDSFRYYLFVKDRILAESFYEDGRWSRCNSSSIDIVSRWEEEIDKETLVLIGSFKDMCKTLNYNKGVYKKEYLEQMEKRCLAWIKEKAKQD